jgi:glycosyltransferase involved in cell wall biosynthesis
VKRIVHIIAGVGQGGAEKVLADVVNHGAGTLEHHVIALLAGEPFFELRAKSFHSLQLNKRQLSHNALWQLRKTVKEIRPDLVHGWLYHGNFASIFVRDLTPRLMWSIHNTDLSPRFSKFTTRLINRLCAYSSHRTPDSIIYVCDQARQVHERIGYSPSKGAVIENGVDLDYFKFDAAGRTKVRKSLGIGANELLLGCVARFDHQKDHRTLAQSFAIIANKIDNARLALIGEGCSVQNAQLADLLEETGVKTRTLLLGKRSDIPSVMSALDLLVIASAYGEALPLVGLEAAAIGLPIVATDVGDVAPFVLADEDIVEPRNPELLAAAIAKAIERKSRGALDQQQSERRRILEVRFSTESMLDRYNQIYLASASFRPSP